MSYYNTCITPYLPSVQTLVSKYMNIYVVKFNAYLWWRTGD